jgi:CMP-N,N'-diacetyllegionaminic acid synthase
MIVIPARQNSKGLPFKNRLLFEETASTIPPYLCQDVYVSSDDQQILALASRYLFNPIQRPDNLALDTTSTKDVLLHLKDTINPSPDDDIYMLYLTYPEREWEQIESFINEYKKSNAKSMLCKKEPQVSPYLMMYNVGDNKGKQIITHDLYRRQDYPSCFEISHFMFACKVSELESLNNNLYNSNTLFYNIDDCIDVDLKEDLEKYENQNHS